ncbi:MAG: HAMP domain-containing sensor histidine kinase [Acidobacteriota bacterium]
MTGEDRHDAGLVARNAELRRSNSELEARLREKDELLTLLAHDLRGPLMGLRIRLETLTGQLADDPRPEVHEELEQATHTLDDLSDLLSRLLALRKLTDSTKGGDEVDLGRLVEKVIAGRHREASDKRIEVQLEQALPATVMSDGVLIERILDNLLSNAIKFSDFDSSIQVSILPARDSVYIAVEDAGPGLTVEDQENLCGPFARLSARPTGGEPSMGLGLYIVRKLVEALGGQLFALSAGSGRGSTFTVALARRA